MTEEVCAVALARDWDSVPFDSCRLKMRIKIKKVKRSEYKPVGRIPVVDQGQDFIAGYWDEPGDAYDGP